MLCNLNFKSTKLPHKLMFMLLDSSLLSTNVSVKAYVELLHMLLGD